MSLTTLTVFLLFVTLFLGGLFRPIFGVLGYLSIYLIYDHYAWWCQPIKAILQRPSLVASAFLITGALIHHNKLDWHISGKELKFYLFLLCAWIVSFFSGLEMHAGTWKYLDKILKGFVFIFFFIRIVSTFDNFKLVVWGLVIGGVFLSYQGHTIGSYYNARLENIGGADFHEANSLAALLAIIMILTSFELLKGHLIKKIFFVAVVALIFDTIVLTKSRAVFIGLIISIPYVLLYVPRLYKRRIFIYVFLAVIMALNLMDTGFLDRMGTIDDAAGNLQSTDSMFQEDTLTRVDFWRASIKIFKDKPMGIGVDNFHVIVPRYDPRNPGKDAHNTFVICYTEIGLVGIILFLAIIFESFLTINRTQKMGKGTSMENEISLVACALGSAIVGYVSGGMMTHSYLYLEITWILFALPLCLERAVLKLQYEQI